MISIRLTQWVLAAPLLLLSAFPAHSFESDVHFGLTKWLALKAGFTDQQASFIALGNQRADSGIMDSIELVLEYACLGKHADASQVAQNYHFASDSKVPASAEKRAIVAGSPASRREIGKVLAAARSGKADLLLVKLGEAMHLMQDSWAYQGTPDVPVFEDVPIQCDATLNWNPPKTRGGFDSHKADLSREWHNDIESMARASYEILTQYPPVGGKTRVPINWALLQPDLKTFTVSKTKQEKAAWFQSQGIKDTSFLAGISLPDGTKPFTETWTGRKLLKLTSAQSPQYEVADEIKVFYSQFFQAWLGSADPESALVKSVGEQQRDLAARLKLWRMRDHGAVAELAHKREPLTKKELATVEQLGKASDAYIQYENLADAYFPLMEQGPGVSPLMPYVIHTLPAGANGNPLAIAVTKLQHAPYDELGIIAERIDGTWQAARLISMVNH